MQETFTFTPLPVETATGRTVKQQQANARRMLKKLEKSIVAVYWKSASGHQLLQLRRIVDFCYQEGIEVPLWVRWHIRLHRMHDTNPVYEKWEES